MKRTILSFSFLLITFLNISLVQAQIPKKLPGVKKPKVNVGKKSGGGGSSSQNSSSGNTSSGSANTQTSGNIQDSPAYVDYRSLQGNLKELSSLYSDQKFEEKSYVSSYKTYLNYATVRIGVVKDKDPNLDLSQEQADLDKYQKRYDEHLAAEEKRKQEEAQAKADAEREKKEGPVKDDGITSDFHGANLNKCVFSTKKLELENPNPSYVKTSFNLTEPILMRIYVPQSLGNTYRELTRSKKYPEDTWEYYQGYYGYNGYLQYRLIVDGEEKDRWEKHWSGQSKIETWTTWWEELLPTDDMAWPFQREGSLFYHFGKMVQDLKPGEHKVNLEIYATDGDKIIGPMLGKGGFDLNFSQSQWNIFDKKWGPKEVKINYSSRGSSSSSTSSSSGSSSARVTLVNDCSGTRVDYCIKDGASTSHSYLSGSTSTSTRLSAGAKIYKGKNCDQLLHTVGSGSDGKKIYLCK